MRRCRSGGRWILSCRRKKSDGWRLAREYVDQASGGKADRLEFQRLFRDAAERKFDLVLFWSLDRFSREGVLETLLYLQRLQTNGVGWWNLKEECLRSVGPFADAVLAILACVAKQERIRIQERVRAGLARAVAEGKRLGRLHRIVDRRKVLQLHREGRSLREIARAVGVSAMTVQRLLRALDKRSERTS